jgi:hypothetical protein
MLLWAKTHPQRLADMEGILKSLRNTSRAAVILARSVYDYTYELGAIPYNTDQYHEKRSEVPIETNKIDPLSSS